MIIIIKYYRVGDAEKYSPAPLSCKIKEGYVCQPRTFGLLLTGPRHYRLTLHIIDMLLAPCPVFGRSTAVDTDLGAKIIIIIIWTTATGIDSSILLEV